MITSPSTSRPARRIVYNDPRRFGFMQLIPRPEFAAHPLFKNIGIEPLGGELDGAGPRPAVRGADGAAQIRASRSDV